MPFLVVYQLGVPQKMPSSTLTPEKDHLVQLYYAQRQREQVWLKANYNDLTRLLGISHIDILLSQAPSIEAICEGQNPPPYYILIPSTVSFQEIEHYKKNFFSLGLITQWSIGESFHSLCFTAPLFEVLEKLEKNINVNISEIPASAVDTPRPILSSFTSLRRTVSTLGLNQTEAGNEAGMHRTQGINARA